MIEDKAVELGRLIGQSDEYKAVRQARELIERAGDLKTDLQQLEGLATKLEEALRRGEEPDQDTRSQYESMLSRIQTDARYQQLVAAQSNFDKIMVRVNERILEGMEKGAESSIITLS